MPSFSRSGDFYVTSLTTGPSSALVQLRFSDDHTGPPTVVSLGVDERHGNATNDEIASEVLDAVQQANERFGSARVLAEVRCQSDNDARCALIRRAAYVIVRRLADVGDDAFIGVA